jgi:hypothetical protein
LRGLGWCAGSSSRSATTTPNLGSLGHDLDAAATTRLDELLDEFLAIRDHRDGLIQTFGAYLAMLRRHGVNYDGSRRAERRAAALPALTNSEP